MRDERGVVAGCAGWSGGWPRSSRWWSRPRSAASAIKLAGVPDPGWITTYGLPVVGGVGQLSAAIALGSAVLAAFFVPAQADGIFDIGGYRAMRISAVASLVWGVCALLGVPLAISDVSGETFAESIKPANLTHAYGQVAGAQTWLWTAIFALLAAVLARVVWRWGWSVGVIVLVTLSLMPPALAGHSSSGGGYDLATNSLILHIVAAAVWAGGLFAVPPALARGRWRMLAVRRFSRVAFCAYWSSGLRRDQRGDAGADRRPARHHLRAADPMEGRGVRRPRSVGACIGAGRSPNFETSADDEPDAPWWKSLFVRFGVVELVVFAATFGLAAGLSRTPPPVDTASISPVELKIGYLITEPPSFARLMLDWRFDLIFGTLAIILAVVYLRGVVRLRCRGDEWPIGGPSPGCWAVSCSCWLPSSGLGRYSSAMFSIHDLAHDDVDDGAGTAGLGRAGHPGVAGIGTCRQGQSGWTTGMDSHRYSQSVGRIINTSGRRRGGLVGSFYVLLSGWPLFETVIDYHAAHLLMNLHFLVSGYVFYWLAIGIDPPRGR